MLKDELEIILASDNGWVGRATLVLALGILGEYTLPRLSGASSRWTRLAQSLCALLVVGGIAGEYGFSARIAQDLGELQRITDQELAQANYRAAKAADQVSQSSKHLEGLTLENFKLKTDLLKLRNQVSPRRLSNEQRSGITGKLREFGRLQAQLDRELMSPEVRDLSDDILAALGPSGAGWVMMDFTSPDVKSAPRGISVEALPYATARGIEAARILVESLRHDGLGQRTRSFCSIAKKWKRVQRSGGSSDKDYGG